MGDAFGYCVEFQRLPEIRSRFGPEGIKEPVYRGEKLVVSDDTQMTLFTLEGLLETLRAGTNLADSALQAIQRAYLNWYVIQRGKIPSKSRGWLGQQPEMCVRRAPGNTCLSALAAGGVGTIENPINASKGCGGAMRAAPIGLFPKRLNPEAAFRLAAQAAALTHGHPSGYLSAGMVAAIVCFLVGGEPLAHAVERCFTILTRWQGYEETLDITKRALEMAQQPSPDHLANIGRLGEGWVGQEALAIALYAAIVGGTYVDVIRIAANHDGDSDSTASIAGQFWGAWKGLDGIPHEWVTRVDVLVPLLHLTRQSVSHT